MKKRNLILIGICLLILISGCTSSSFNDCVDICKSIEGDKVGCNLDNQSVSEYIDCRNQFREVCFDECKFALTNLI